MAVFRRLSVLHILVCLFSVYDVYICVCRHSERPVRVVLWDALMPWQQEFHGFHDVFCSDWPLRFLVLNAAFTVRNVGKEAGGVTGRG